MKKLVFSALLILLSIQSVSATAPQQDRTTYTEGNDFFMPAGCVYNDALADLVPGYVGVQRCTKQREAYVNIAGGTVTAIGAATSSPAVTQPTCSASSALLKAANSNRIEIFMQLMDSTAVVDICPATTCTTGTAMIRLVGSGVQPPVLIINTSTSAYSCIKVSGADSIVRVTEH